jgi:MFS family permease
LQDSRAAQFSNLLVQVIRMQTERAAQKITRILFLSQGLGSAALIAASTVGSIVGAKLGGSAAWGGVPAAVYLLGSALSALVWGHLTGRAGWRAALICGAALGAAGALVAGISIQASRLLPFLAALPMLGAAQSIFQLSRFASAEVHPPDQRGRAISNVVLGGTVGAIFGPLLVGPFGRWARASGLDELAGPYGITFLLCLLVGGLIFLSLRPDPRDLGRQIYPGILTGQDRGESKRSIGVILRQPGAVLATTAMVGGQIVMVMVMVITALHMRGHDHALSSVSFVISSHTFGMFAFSLVSGRLADRWGRVPVIATGAATLLLACLLAPLSPQVVPLSVALFLLGLGWNFCFVGGSSLLADNLLPGERNRVQGLNDLLIGLASAASSLNSGLVFAALGFGAMSLAGAGIALLLLFLALYRQFIRPAVTGYP